MRIASPLRGQRGFTLAELLVACAVIAFVMAGLLLMLQTGQESYLIGSNQVEAQQNVRLAIDRMIGEVRNAGYCPTCPGIVPPFASVTSQTSSGFTLQNDWNGNGSIASSGTVTDGSGTTRGEQIAYSLSSGALRRQETGVDTAAVTLASGINSLSFTYQDSAGTTTTASANIRTIVITVKTQPSVAGASSQQGKVYVEMTDSVRLRNR